MDKMRLAQFLACADLLFLLAGPAPCSMLRFDRKGQNPSYSGGFDGEMKY